MPALQLGANILRRDERQISQLALRLAMSFHIDSLSVDDDVEASGRNYSVTIPLLLANDMEIAYIYGGIFLCCLSFKLCQNPVMCLTIIQRSWLS